MKTPQEPKEGRQVKTVKSARPDKHAEIKTDYPLSEKDEIKEAEERMRKATKKK